jgi:hypothetical protein
MAAPEILAAILRPSDELSTGRRAGVRSAQAAARWGLSVGVGGWSAGIGLGRAVVLSARLCARVEAT